MVTSKTRPTGMAASMQSALVITALELHELLDNPLIRIVDLRPSAHGVEGYIPGSVHLDYDQLIRRSEPVEGLVPDVQQLSVMFSKLGLERGQRVIVYDDETGLEAARLLWTLSLCGHEALTLLDGGFSSWQEAGLPIVETLQSVSASNYQVAGFNNAMVDKDYVLAALQDPQACIVDTRSLAEYNGEEVRANRPGHIPGAKHFDWSFAVDLFGSGRLLAPEELSRQLDALAITPDREVILYCQSNRRASHTWVVLNRLGYGDVKCYAGAWSEWGNASNTPVEC